MRNEFPLESNKMIMALYDIGYSGPPVAVTCAVILIVLYVLIFREGRRAFRLFDIKGKHRQGWFECCEYSCLIL